MGTRDTYVVYSGDDVVAVGTASEVSEALGVRRSTVEYLATPIAHRKAATGRRRMVAERVTEDEAR